jgi:DNA-binding NarL/FixJ family response regulator
MKFLIVDDHAIVRSGLSRLLAALGEVEITETGNGRDAINLFRSIRPDLVLLDINLPGLGGLELLRRLRLDDPEARVLMFSMHDEAIYARRALQAGARGYATKNIDPDALLTAITRILNGGRYIEPAIAEDLALRSLDDTQSNDQLTARDLEILRLLAEGSSLSEIADRLALSYKTVANNCSQIKAKLGVVRTADLIRLSIEMGSS